MDWTPLHLAAQMDSLEAARLLLDHGADVDDGKRGGWRPLHAAVYFLQEAAVRLLIERNCDVNAQDDDGRTPLEALYDNLARLSQSDGPGLRECIFRMLLLSGATESSSRVAETAVDSGADEVAEGGERDEAPAEG
ncbi:ankyrin repeat-containing domain protein [Schizophyllum amplum]|uniref:Ankyrin repeat-containing domain protein n=1 Tax=Schizophyllum amplum TaxID=97359 RepID=A0A550BXR6_9AGAR|nr:ankyrin repeat-containing domain protein [Auriculariopsis ampla]